MDDLPSFDDAESLTEWVIETAAETDISAYTLWRILKANAQDDKSDLSKSDIDRGSLGPEIQDARDHDGEEEYVPGQSQQPEPGTGPEPDPALGMTQHEEDVERPGESGDIVRQEDYDQFKNEVQGLIQNLIEFLISYDMLSDHNEDEHDELISEFEMLTRDFEEDVSEFFTHLDGLLSQGEAESAETSADVPIEATDELSELLDQLRTSVEDLEDIPADGKEETAQAIEADLETLSEVLDDGQYEADDDISRSLGRLNRLLDEVGEYPAQSQSNSDAQRPETDHAPPQQREPAPESRMDQQSSEYTETSHQRHERPPQPAQESRMDQQSSEYAETSHQRHDSAPQPPQESRMDQQSSEYAETSHQRQESAPQQNRAAPRQAAGITSQQQRGYESGSTHSREESRETTSTTGWTQYAGFLGLLPIDLGWLGAGVAYGGLDMLTTTLVIRAGGRELNPIFDLLGGSLPGFVLWKTFILFMLFVFFYPDDPSQPESLEWLVPLLVTAAGVILTVSNLFVIVG